MFEAQVAYYLNEYLGKYVQGIDRESLKISIYAGDVVLRNLRLKPDALEELDLPVSVHAGLLGMLRLKVPWNNLGGTPVVVDIDDLYLLVRPRGPDSKGNAAETASCDDWEAFEQGFQDSKMSRVSRKEKSWVRNVLKMKDKGQGKSKGFLRGLIDTIISNLQISITNIHVRYEDAQTRPRHTFSCGCTLQKLSACTVDATGKETFMASNTMDALRKTLQLKRAAVYFDCDTVLWSPVDDSWDTMDPDVWKEWFEPDIRDDTTGRCYVIEPVDGHASYVRRWKDLDQEREAATELHIELSSICASVSRDQYCNYSLLLSEISQYTARLPYAGFVPHCRPEQGCQARAWWMYLLYVHRQNAETRKFRWRNVIYSIRVRSKYISLFKKNLKMEGMKATKGLVIPDDFDEQYAKNRAVLEDMERRLQENTILIFRKVAHTEYDDEVSKEAEQAKTQQQKGWLGWLMGSNGSPEVNTATDMDDTKVSISYEEYDTILETIEVQEASMSLKFETPYTLLSKYTVHVGSVSVNLVGDSGVKLFKGSMEQISTELISYPITKRVTVAVEGMGVDSQYGCFVKTGMGSEGSSGQPLANALALSFVKRPQDERSDAILTVDLAPSFIYYDPLAVGSVVDFFQPPDELMLQDLGDISLVAATQLSRAKQAAADYAVAAWSGKPKLEMCLTLNAPKISFPSKLADVHLALDLGLFVIQTDTVTSQSLKGREKGLYECIKVTGQNISASLMGATVEWDMAFATSKSGSLQSHLPLLDQCSLDMSLRVARYTDEENPMIQIRPQIPKLQFFISPERVNRLLQVLNNISELHEASDLESSPGGKDLTWLSSADWMRECFVLQWSSLQSNAVWRPHQVVLYHGTLYALQDGSRCDISRQMSIDKDTIINKLPNEIIESENILVVHKSKSADWKEILRRGDSLVLKFDNLSDLQSCFEEVNACIHRSHVHSSGEISTQESQQSDESISRIFVYIEGGLSELQVVVSGCPPRCCHAFSSTEETNLISLKASKGSFTFSYGDEAMIFNTSLVAMEIDDLVMEAITGEKRYITRSATVLSQSNTENLAEFTLKLLSPRHPDYIGVQTALEANLGSFFFFCNRPTVAALISFGSDIASSGSSSRDTVIDDDDRSHPIYSVYSASDIVLYCKDYTSKTFAMDVALQNLQLLLCFEQSTNLAEASVSDFRFKLETISDGLIQMNASLGNLYINDLTLDQSNQYSNICGVRDAGKSSLVTIQFDMYPAHVKHSLDAPENMICYSLIAHLSKLKIVFLYRFIQECIQYLSSLLEFRPTQIHELEPSILSEDSQSYISVESNTGEQPFLLLMNLSMDAPLITIPRSSNGDDSIKADLGTVSLQNKILPDLGHSLLDNSILSLTGVQIYPSSLSKGDEESLVTFSEEGWLVTWKRPLGSDYTGDIPRFDMEIEISDLRASLSNRNFEDLVSIISTNISENPDTQENAFMMKPDDVTMESKDTISRMEKNNSLTSPTVHSAPNLEGISFRVYIYLHHLRLNLFQERKDGLNSNLSYMQIDQTYFSYTSIGSGHFDIDLSLPKLEISDTRPHVPPEHSLVISSGQRASLLMLRYCCGSDKKLLDVILQKPLVVLELGFLIDLSAFFVPQFSLAKVDPLPFVSHDIILTQDEFTLAGDIYLSPAIRILADSKPGEYYIDGNGHSIILPYIYDMCTETPLIVIGSNCSLTLKNVKIANAASLDICVKLGPGARLHLPAERGVQLEDDNDTHCSGEVSVPDSESAFEEEPSFVFCLTTSNLGLYLLQRRDAGGSPGDLNTKIIAFKTDLDLEYISKARGQELKVDLNNLRATQSNISNLKEQITARSNQALESHKKIIGTKESDILLPLRVKFNCKSTLSDIDMDLSISEAHVMVSPGALESVARYIEDAVAPLQQPGPDNPVFAVSTYQKIASLYSKSIRNNEMQSELLVKESDIITFWRPHSSTGCSIAGDVITVGKKAPSFEVVALSNNSGLIMHPESFDKIFSSREITIWMPIAPKGYSNVGLFATIDGKPPSVEDVCCIANAALIHVPKGGSTSICSDGSILELINIDNSFGSFVLGSTQEMEGKSLDLRYPIGPTTYALFTLPFSDLLMHGSNNNQNSVSRTLQQAFIHSQRKNKVAKSGVVNHSKTTDFKRIWTDSGALSASRGVSIWRPVASSGYSILGDCFMNGFDPPSYAVTLRSEASRLGKIGDEYLADPLKYDLIWHDGNPKLDQRLSIWNPVAPQGYVSMGSIAKIGGGLPDVEIKCLSQKFSAEGIMPRNPVWIIRRDDMTINPLSVWRVDEQTCCFTVDPSDNALLPKYLPVLNMSSINGNTQGDPGRTVNAVIRTRSWNVTFYDSFRVPILKSSIGNVESGIRGYSKQVVQSYGGFQPSLSAYNSKIGCWEPIIEPFDAIVKVDANFTGEISSGIEPGIHVGVKSSTENILTTFALSHVNAILYSYDECMTAIKRSENLVDSHMVPSLSEKWLRSSVIVNDLGVSIELELENNDGVKLVPISNGRSVTIDRSTSSELLEKDSIKESIRTGGMLLLDIKDVCCTVPNGSRVAVDAFFDRCKRNYNPRTRALKAKYGSISFNERLVLNCDESILDDAKVIIQVWDVQGKLGKGSILYSGTFDTKCVTKEATELTVDLNNSSTHVINCIACWQHNSVLDRRHKSIDRPKLTSMSPEQRALSIKGSQNVWKILPELPRRINSNDQKVISKAAVELEQHTIVIEGSVENHLWHERFRSNCIVSNMTDLSIEISTMGSQGEIIEVVGLLSPKNVHPLPLGWADGKYLSLRPNIFLKSNGESKPSHQYNWSMLDTDARNVQIGIDLNMLDHQNSTFVVKCESEEQGKAAMVFSALITSEFIQGTELLDWCITISPPIIIRNHIPKSISLSLFDGEQPLDCQSNSTVLSIDEKLPVYFLGSNKSLQFKMDCGDYKWAEQGLVVLTGEESDKRESIRVCKENQRIPSEIFIKRAKQVQYQDSQDTLLNQIESLYPMTITLSSPLWVLNKTDCIVEISAVSVRSEAKQGYQQLRVDYVPHDDPVYDSVMFSSDGNGSQYSSVANSRHVDACSMLLMSIPSSKDSAEENNVCYGIKIRVQNTGWTDPILFDKDFATKHGYVSLSSAPLLIMSESRTRSTVYGVVLYLETNQFADSKVLHLESQILLQNNSRVPIQAFQCEKDIVASENNHKTSMILPKGGTQVEQEPAFSKAMYSVKSFVQMPDNVLSDMLKAKAIFDIPADSISNPVNFPSLNSSYICLRQSLEKRVDNFGLWGRPIDIRKSEESLDYVVIPIVSRNTCEGSLLLRICFSSRGPGLKLITIESAECLPKYVLVNKSPFLLHAAQIGSKNTPIHTLQGFSASGYVAEFSTVSRVKVELFGPQLRPYSAKISLNDDLDSELKEFSISSSQMCTIRTLFESICTLTPYEKHSIPGSSSGYVLGRGDVDKIFEITSGCVNLQWSSQQEEEEMEYFVTVQAPSVSISIIDLKPQELALITVEDIKFGFDKVIMPDGIGTCIKILARHIQVDNQLPGTLLPVALCRAIGSKLVDPMLDFKYSSFVSKNRSSVQLPYVGFRISNRLQVAIEESLIWKIYAVYEYMANFYPSQDDSHITAAVDAFVHVRLLSVGEVPLSVSFQNNSSIRPASLQDSSLSLILDLAAFKGADVKLKGFEMDNVQTTFSGFNARVQEKIKSELMSVGFSLVRTFGFVGGAQRLIGFLGAKAVKFASSSDRAPSKKISDPSLPARPGTSEDESFGSSMLKGFRGLVNKPIEGARAEGLEGAFKGMAKGVVGVFTAPVSNTLTKAPDTYDASFAKDRSAVLVLQRKRLPRVLGATGKISEIQRAGSIQESILESLGQSFLWATLIADSSKIDQSRMESYEEHFVLPDGFVLMFTNSSMLHIYSPDFAAMDGAAEIGSLPAIEIPAGIIKWRIFWWDLLAMELRWSDERYEPDRLIVHRKGRTNLGSALSIKNVQSNDLAQELLCFPKTPQASQIKFVANTILSRYYRDPTRLDIRWAIRHAARLALQQGASATDFPSKMLSTSFETMWHTNPARSPVVYFWKPVAPPGYKPVGTVATLGPEQPLYPVYCFRDDVTLQRQTGENQLPVAFPEEYSLIWRFNGARPVSMWMPIPPHGYVAMGAVIMQDALTPSMDDYVCIREDLVLNTPLFDSAIWSYNPEAIQSQMAAKQQSSQTSMKMLGMRSESKIKVIPEPKPSYLPETWKVSVWQVDSPLMTLLVARGLKKPPQQLSYSLRDP